MLQFQAMKVATDLAVRIRENIDLKEQHDALENASKLFNVFAVSIVVGSPKSKAAKVTTVLYCYIFKL